MAKEEKDDVSAQDQVTVQIINNRDSGACVALATTSDGLIAKTMFCKSKTFLSCQDSANTIQTASVEASN